MGHNWSGFDGITQFGAIERNGLLDIVAVQDGVLWGYGSDGGGGFKGGRAVGPGWDAFRMLTAPGDWNGDGQDDLMAVRSADHTLWMWPGNGRGGLGPGRQIGYGYWDISSALTGAGDFDGDANNDFLRLQQTFWLLLHPGNGAGGARMAVSVSDRPWPVTALVGPGDFDGDGRTDIIVRASDGRLLLYRGNGAGSVYSGSIPIGHGWQQMSILGDNAESKSQYCDRVGSPAWQECWSYSG